MGKKTIINEVQKMYLAEFDKKEYTLVEFNSKNRFIDSFESMFDVTKKYNLLEEVDKTIVCQWFMSKEDWRFENFIGYLLVPNTPYDMTTLNFDDILVLISPHNVVNR